MSQTSETVQRKLDEVKAEKHRVAQQKYYWTNKGKSITNLEELERLRNEVSNLTGQLTEKENAKIQLQSQLNEKINQTIQLQQQLLERNTAISQLQILLSKCGSNDETQRPIDSIQELVQALTSEIQRGQQCLQIIDKLNSEKEWLEIYKNILVELNNKYPKILKSFVYELQYPGNNASLVEVQDWAREQAHKLNINEVSSLIGFK